MNDSLFVLLKSLILILTQCTLLVGLFNRVFFIMMWKSLKHCCQHTLLYLYWNAYIVMAMHGHTLWLMVISFGTKYLYIVTDKFHQTFYTERFISSSWVYVFLSTLFDFVVRFFLSTKTWLKYAIYRIEVCMYIHNCYMGIYFDAHFTKQQIDYFYDIRWNIFDDLSCFRSFSNKVNYLCQNKK